MNSLRVLDVTLRDGGCVNNFDFGKTYIDKILKAQEASGIDIIEVGYIDENKGSEYGRTQYINEKVIERNVIIEKKKSIEYVAMIDYGKFDIDNLESRTPYGIDGIRMAFHKKDYLNIADVGRKIIEKGYNFYIQPMITLRYNDMELLELINLVNEKISDASAFYIVDSFGEMRPNDMSRVMNLIDNNLIPSMAVGFHSHNNLQMSYSNAISMLKFPTNRDLLIDCSIMGMGKGAGNLNTELLLEHLNIFYGKNYKLGPLLEIIDRVINQLHSEFYWGYAPEYYLSAVNKCTPSYASYYYNKHMLPIEQVSELLNCIPNEKKISFDCVFAEKLYREYNERKDIDDSEAVEKLMTEFSDKDILLIAPGKSIIEYMDEILCIAKKDNVVTIGLNTVFDFNDYILVTRKEIFEATDISNKKVIVCSNNFISGNKNTYILNYKKWIEVDEQTTHDSSSVIALNLLKRCRVGKIILAGFDGFDININENYYDPNLRHPVSVEQVDKRNQYYKQFIGRIVNEGNTIVFVTPSKYE